MTKKAAELPIDRVIASVEETMPKHIWLDAKRNVYGEDAICPPLKLTEYLRADVVNRIMERLRQQLDDVRRGRTR